MSVITIFQRLKQDLERIGIRPEKMAVSVDADSFQRIAHEFSRDCGFIEDPIVMHDRPNGALFMMICGIRIEKPAPTHEDPIYTGMMRGKSEMMRRLADKAIAEGKRVFYASRANQCAKAECGPGGSNEAPTPDLAILDDAANFPDGLPTKYAVMHAGEVEWLPEHPPRHGVGGWVAMKKQLEEGKIALPNDDRLHKADDFEAKMDYFRLAAHVAAADPEHNKRLQQQLVDAGVVAGPQPAPKPDDIPVEEVKPELSAYEAIKAIVGR